MNELVQCIGGMILRGVNENNQKKPVSLSLLPPQIPHGLA
jgi:hypothetical protein